MSTSVQNYTVVGNPTISSDYIASNFTDSDYIVCGRSKSSGAYTVLLKVTVDSLPSANTPILTQTYDFTTGGETVQAVGAYVGLNFFESGGSTVGPYFALSLGGTPAGVLLSISANTSYWLKLEADSYGSYATLSAIEDNNYTIDTLPDSGWTSAYDSSAYDKLHNATSYVGYYSTLSNSTVSVDLKTLRMIQDNSIVWGAVYALSPISGVDFTNYRIIGSPTFADGVYSDFSSSNYLVIPSVLKNTNYSYFFKFTTGSNVSTTQNVAHAERFFNIGIDQGNVKCWSWDSQTGGAKTLFACSANTTYWVLCKYSGSTRTYSHSTDGSHWTQDLQFTDDGLQTNENGYDFKVGLESVADTDSFLGSVDFNEVFVVDNSTMLPVWSPYTKRKNVVDYTVVGSPTLTDHVASDFTTSNFIRMGKAWPATYNSFEFVIKITTASSTSNSNTIVGRDSGRNFTITGDGCKISSNSSSYDIGTISYSFPANTTMWLKLTHNGSIYEFSRSTDGHTWTSIGTINSTTKMNGSIQNHFGVYADTGAASGVDPFNGSIDLKETYVKINGEYYWIAFDASPKYEGGSVFVGQGLYTDGSHEIKMIPTTASLQDLTDGHQKLEYKNSLYAASKNNVASVHLVGTGQTIQGSYDVSVDLEHPVYLSHLKNYVLGDVPDTITASDVSYTSEAISLNVSDTFTTDDTGSNTYWYTSTVTVNLADMKQDCIGDRSSLDLVNIPGRDTASVQLYDAKESVLSGNKRLPTYYAFLNHMHGSILGWRTTSLELSIISDLSFSGNYSLVGSPTINIQGVASGFSSTAYMYITPLISSNASTFELTTHIRSGSNITEPQAMFSSESTQAQLIKCNGSKLGFYTQNSGDSCNYTISTYTQYWIKCVLTASSYTVYAYPYTEGVNPPASLSEWNVCGTTTASTALNQVRAAFTYNVRIPTNGDNSYPNQYWRGYVYLSDSSLDIDSGDVTWTGGSTSPGTYVQSDQWSWMNGQTYGPVASGLTRVNVSDLLTNIPFPSATEYNADLIGYLCIKQATQNNAYPLLFGVTTSQTSFGFPSVDTYTGYSYTVSDVNGSTMLSLTKTGTRCRMFKSVVGNTTEYLFAPSAYFTGTDRTVAASVIRLATVTGSAVPFRQFTTPTGSVFNYTADTNSIQQDGGSTIYVSDGTEVYIERNNLS